MNPGPGEQPSTSPTETPSSTTPTVPSPPDANSTATGTPPVQTTETTPVTPPTTGPERKLPTNLDELLAVITPEQAAALSSQEIDALTKGDRKAVARILKLPEDTAATTQTTSTPEPPAGPTTTTEDVLGVERLSLRGMSAKDQRKVADAVTAVKDGKYGTFDEALVAMGIAPTEQAQTEQPAPEKKTAPEPLKTTPQIEALEAENAQLDKDLDAAVKSYNNAEIARISRRQAVIDGQILNAKEALERQNKDAVARFQQEQEADEKWYADQKTAGDAADAAYPDLRNPESAFTKAYLDAKDLGILRGDPIFQSADWPLKLAERVKAALGSQPGRPPLPTPPAQGPRTPLGQVAVPSQATPTMSPDEALDELEKIQDPHEREQAINAVLRGMKEREKAARFGGR